MKKLHTVFIFLIRLVLRILNKIHTSQIIQNVFDTDNNKVILLDHDLSIDKNKYDNIENVGTNNLISSRGYR
jgi:hypothetical protein